MSTDKQTNYSDSMSYEYFIARAFQFNKKLRRPSNQEFLNLIEAENGNRPTYLPTFDNQLKEIKERINKAVIIFISKSKAKEQLNYLKDLHTKIAEINSYHDIPPIVKTGLEITQDFKK